MMLRTTVNNHGVHPKNVGILAIEIYFPKSYVDQDSLEDFDGVSKGKYTIGLGQKEMGFCYDNEDVNSLCLTVVSKLMTKHKVNYKNIGRLEVGTETVIDKSKSVKTVLMKLFEESENYDVEGVDTTNACYGGTSALFNAVAWVESSSWDGRLAMVVCGDIAVYATGNARCTGGAGAVAMLIGPNAPLILEPGLRGSCMRHTYDFYKPDLTSEYPVFDGKLTVQSYITALDTCYETYCKKANHLLKKKDNSFTLQDFDFMLFHSPYAKLVQKSLARLALNDYMKQSVRFYPDHYQEEFKAAAELQLAPLPDSIFDRNVEKVFMTCSEKMFRVKTLPSLFLAKRIGNMYTPSLYGCLVSLLIKTPLKGLCNKRIGMFSYGSGCASTMFSIYIPAPTKFQPSSSTNGLPKLSTLEFLLHGLNDVEERLNDRICVMPEEFTKALHIREETHTKPDYKPKAATDSLFSGTYFLTHVDEKFRRNYECKV